MCCPSFESWVSCRDVQTVGEPCEESLLLGSFPYALNKGKLSAITLYLIVSPLPQTLYTTPSYNSPKMLNYHKKAK